MKSKLAYLCSSTSWGGLEMNHLRNAFWMRERNHDVVVLCVKDSPIANQASSMELPTIFIERHKKYYDFSKARLLKTIIEQNAISHLIIRSTLDMSITAAVKRKMGSKLHTSYFMEMQLGVKKTNVMHSFRYKYIDVWSCPLHWLKVQVENLTKFKNELVVIPSGLNLKQFNNLPAKSDSRKTLDLPLNAFILGLIGRFDEQKGQLLLLEAMTHTARSDYSIVLLGEPTLNEDNDYFERMQELISKNNLEDRVHLRSFRKDAETFYNAIDWLVMATKAETFGMVTIEALASGKPVLGSNAGGTPEILEQNKGGLLFETQNPQELAKQIDRILDESITLDRESLKKLASHYDHEKVCLDVEKVLGLS